MLDDSLRQTDIEFAYPRAILKEIIRGFTLKFIAISPRGHKEVTDFNLRKEGTMMLPVLTDREEHILALIASGLKNKEIAHHLSISEATVENHVHHIYLKLGISNRAQAVIHALQAIVIQQNEVNDNGGNPS